MITQYGYTFDDQPVTATFSQGGSKVHERQVRRKDARRGQR